MSISNDFLSILRREQQQLWAKMGNYNDYYNDTMLRKRSKWFVNSVLKKYCFKSVFEVGCNSGRNLLYVQSRYNNVKIGGSDVNSGAINFVKEKLPSGCFSVSAAQDLNTKDKYDIVMTSGLLSHIMREDLQGVLHKCIKKANKYVIHMETHGHDVVINGPVQLNPVKRIKNKLNCYHNYIRAYKELGYSVDLAHTNTKEEGAYHLIIIDVGDKLQLIEPKVRKSSNLVTVSKRRNVAIISNSLSKMWSDNSSVGARVYPDLLKKHHDVTTYDGYSCMSLCALARLRDLKAKGLVDVVVVHIGVSDVIPRRALKNVRHMTQHAKKAAMSANNGDVLEQFNVSIERFSKQKDPGAKMSFLSDDEFKWSLNAIKDELVELNAIVVGIHQIHRGDYRIIYQNRLNIHDAVFSDPSIKLIKTKVIDYGPDRIHFSRLGHIRIANSILKLIETPFITDGYC